MIALRWYVLLLLFRFYGVCCPADTSAQTKRLPSQSAWMADASRATLPRHRAQGRFQGRPFTLGQSFFEHAEIYSTDPKTGKETTKDYDGYAIYLCASKRLTQAELTSLAFGAKATTDRFEITVYVQPGKSLTNRTILVASTDTNAGESSPNAAQFLYHASSPVQVTLVPRGADTTAAVYLDSTQHEFTLHLHIAQQTARVLRGSVYLSVSDDTFVAGTFDARTLDDRHLLRQGHRTPRKWRHPKPTPRPN